MAEANATKTGPAKNAGSDEAMSGWASWIDEDLPTVEEARWSTHSAARAHELRQLAAAVQKDEEK